MSLYKQFARPCVIMERVETEDGEGGRHTEWAEGIAFDNYQALDTSMEARRAEQQGVRNLYNIVVDQEVPISYGDYFRDTSTGETYRVTSEPDEKKSPPTASFALKFYTAEKKELPE